MYRLQEQLDERDNYSEERYGRVADARDSVLRKRGMTAVQSYEDKSDDVVMTKTQTKRYESLRGEARRNYVNKLLNGQNVG